MIKDKRKKFLINLIFPIFIFSCIIINVLIFLMANNKNTKIDLVRYISNNQENRNSENIFYGNTYYISAYGTSQEGTSISDPMSLEIANNKKFTSKDTILFKSDDIFYGQINFDISTIEGSIAKISSYGNGKKPIISGAKIFTKASDCEKYQDGIYKIYLNGNEMGIQNNNSYCNEIGFIKDEKGNIFGNNVKKISLLSKEMDFICVDDYIYIKSDKNPI